MPTLNEALQKRSQKINKIEKIKSSGDPMATYERLDKIASGGYEKLSKEDSSYFLKCFGLFDKGEHFMLRVRIPGGKLNHAQAKAVGEIAKEYGDDYIDITTRMQIELRYIAIENIAKVIRALDQAGISTFQTGVDNPRNIVTDPLDSIAYDCIIECMPIIEQMQSIFLGDPEWISALPRKFNTGILGSLSNSCNIFGHDCCFVLAQKDGIFGFNLYLGARVGMQAQDADMFVTKEEVPIVFRSLLEIFRDFGYRDNRNKNRLVFLINDVGMQSIVDAIKSISGLSFSSAGVTMVQSENIALGSNRVLGRNGKLNYKLIVPSGIFSGSDIIEAAKLSEEFGSGDIRLAYDQNLFITDIDPKDISGFESSSLMQKYSKYGNLYFRDMIACAGTATCSFGVIPNKPDAIEMANFLNREVPIENAVVRMNWSACPKGCGVHGIADIGLEGCKAKDGDGNRVDGVHLFIGGKITRGAKEAHLLHRALPITEARYHIKYILQLYSRYKDRAETFESFEDRFISQNYSYQAISFFTKINYILQERLGLDSKFVLEREPKSGKNEAYEIFYFGLKLYRLLTGEKRFEAVDGLLPVLKKPKRISRDEVSRLNPKIPLKLSEAIYNMTHEEPKNRAQVFSELLVSLKEI